MKKSQPVGKYRSLSICSSFNGVIGLVSKQRLHWSWWRVQDVRMYGWLGLAQMMSPIRHRDLPASISVHITMINGTIIDWPCRCMVVIKSAWANVLVQCPLTWWPRSDWSICTIYAQQGLLDWIEIEWIFLDLALHVWRILHGPLQ